MFSVLFSIFGLSFLSSQGVWRWPMGTWTLWGVRGHIPHWGVSGLSCISKSPSTLQELPPLNRKSSWSWPCSCWHSVGSRNQNRLTLSFFLRISNLLLPEQSLTSFCLTTLFDLVRKWPHRIHFKPQGCRRIKINLLRLLSKHQEKDGGKSAFVYSSTHTPPLLTVGLDAHKLKEDFQFNSSLFHSKS